MSIDTFKQVRGKPEIDITRGAHLDYKESWVDWLAAASTPPDTLSDAVWTVPAALTNEGEQFTALGVTQVLVFCPADATLDALLPLKCEVTGSGTPPRIDSRTIYLRVVDR